MENIKNEIKKEIFSIENLKIFNKELNEKIEDSYDEIMDNYNGANREKKIKYAEQRIIVDFIEKLKSEKDYFNNIFETENGSIYFTTRNNESWRFKKTNNGEYKVEPILNKIFFVNKDIAQKLEEIKIQDNIESGLIDMEIKKVDISKNAVPIEIGIIGFSDIKFKEFNKDGINYIKIIGTKYEHSDEIEKSFVSGFHQGHSIIKIIK